ncbi:multinuclear nonheme iron-dependent oxidase [Terrimonas alba]|uniref:multinuclear nonheme iron-dependent oxidase n=1 Tax=Terrimonas alba TaxID=3349636 RepID=UPI0035F3F8C6
MPKILSATACNLDADILAACLPLMEESRIEAIEWSFDALFNVKQIPSWFMELLTAFSNEKRLIGHGVFFSIFSGKWLQGQQDWLKQLKQTCETFQFDHVTEHFGFMTGNDFHHGAPLNIPYTQTSLDIGRDRLKRIYDVCRCPVGLENLAFSYSLDETKRHGTFLEQLLEPVNGFIILDLHNLYCQVNNFDISFEEIIALYPLDKVREIHISGGSWEDSLTDPGRKVRRDTHDDAVPEEVFDLLKMTVGQCPNVKYVVLEQLGNGLVTNESKQSFYKDFLMMENIVREKNNMPSSPPANCFLPLSFSLPGNIVEDETLYQQQSELSFILESSASYNEAMHLLKKSSLASSAWQIENWEPYMIETAIKIAQKWKKK